MADKPTTYAKKKSSGSTTAKFKIVAQMIQKSLLLGRRSSFEDEEINVPGDVKAGHFAVIAVDDYKFKRFVVPLSFLTRPAFLRLLGQAEEEYGFGHNEGALTIPCSPSEFEGLMAEQWAEEGSWFW